MVSGVRIKAIADVVTYGNFSSYSLLAYVSRGILCSFLLGVPFAQAYIYSNVRD